MPGWVAWRRHTLLALLRAGAAIVAMAAAAVVARRLQRLKLRFVDGPRDATLAVTPSITPCSKPVQWGRTGSSTRTVTVEPAAAAGGSAALGSAAVEVGRDLGEHSAKRSGGPNGCGGSLASFASAPSESLHGRGEHHSGRRTSRSRSGRRSESSGTPLVVISDAGQDLDDEMSIVMMRYLDSRDLIVRPHTPTLPLAHPHPSQTTPTLEPQPSQPCLQRTHRTYAASSPH